MDTQVDMGLKVHIESLSKDGEAYTRYYVIADDHYTLDECQRGYVEALREDGTPSGYNEGIDDAMVTRIKISDYIAYERSIHDESNYTHGPSKWYLTPKVSFDYTGNDQCIKCSGFTEIYASVDTDISAIAEPRCIPCWASLFNYWARNYEVKIGRTNRMWLNLSQWVTNESHRRWKNTPDDHKCFSCSGIMDMRGDDALEQYQPHEVYNGDDLVQVHERCKFYCSRCENYHALGNMWSSMHNPSMRNNYYFEGERICHSCFSQVEREHDIFMCGGCDNFRYVDDSRQYGNSRVCDGCWDNRNECDDCGGDYISNLHYCDDGTGYIHNYSYMPSLNFIENVDAHDPDSDIELFMGFELEVECEGNLSRAKTAKLITESFGSDRVYCKSDGSLDNGVEMVTHPHTLRAYQDSDFKWETLKELSRQGVVSWNTDSCGLHVHVSRDTFGRVGSAEPSRSSRMGHYIRFAKLLYTNQRQIESLAGRSGNSYATFNDKGKLFEKFQAGSSWDRYTAVNANPHFTLEVRVFKGSLRKERVLSAIELVHAAVQYTRNLKVTPSAFSWVKFVGFLSQNIELYPNLVTIMTESFERTTNREDN